jgi:hypothetical protein
VTVKKSRLVVVALAMAVVPVFAVPGAAAPETCQEPSAEYRYGPSDMVYELSVDLTGCDWWRGSSLALNGELIRTGLDTDHETNAASICQAEDRVSVCRLQLTLEHPGTDVAQYGGRISYPWLGSRKSREFEATCWAVRGMDQCREGRLPVFGVVPPLDQLPVPQSP